MVLASGVFGPWFGRCTQGIDVSWKGKDSFVRTCRLRTLRSRRSVCGVDDAEVGAGIGDGGTPRLRGVVEAALQAFMLGREGESL